MDYYIGQIINETEYTPAVEWCDENNASITEIQPLDNIRRFEIVSIKPHVPTYEEIDELREVYREEHIDKRTKARVRKMANGTWTEEDEREYLALDAEVTAYIEEHYPYPK